MPHGNLLCKRLEGEGLKYYFLKLLWKEFMERGCYANLETIIKLVMQDFCS